MEFIDYILEFFTNEKIRNEFLDFLSSKDTPENKIVTAHGTKDGAIIFSVFDPEQWKLLNEMAEVINKAPQEVVEGLCSDEVRQFVFRPSDHGL